MIDWSKEVATKNYCGYCTNTPTGSICNGECFKDEANRVDHILTMLTTIPEQIKELKLKEKNYRDSLSA